MFYTIYKITNTIDNKIYIGSHKTEELEDGYMGSGKYLKNAIQKHGIENFKKEIIANFTNSEDMFSMEATVVNEEFVKDPNTYNLKEGGEGGFEHLNNTGKNVGWYQKSKENGKHLSEAWKKKCSEDPDFANKMKEIGRTQLEKNRLAGIRGFKGKKHTEESKEKMKQSSIGKSTGKLNSQYGTVWITDGKENKKVKKDSEIPTGWDTGRILN